ncbi:MAG: DUF3524 domain-containing protein, partial [Saprospiraceae bacterium]|nr:DUF3524 domain-containing protein [Saprospiraceae bacterium]
DLILATDMLDLATFCGISRLDPSIPRIVYFHENQLTYPWSPTDPDPALKRDNHYSWINFTSSLAADHVLFNSNFHLQEFLDALGGYLDQFPDHHNKHEISTIRRRSSVLHLGIDLPGFSEKERGAKPIFLWNHRWEYDKNPDLFFNTLFSLQDSGFDFGLIVLGKKYGRVPEIFSVAKSKLKDKILQFGSVESREEYLDWVSKAHFIPVSSNQDFFGGSVVEAISSGVFPILPKRLAYPEHIPAAYHQEVFYTSEDEFFVRLKDLFEVGYQTRIAQDLSQFVARYDWKNSITKYDDLFEKLKNAKSLHLS